MKGFLPFLRELLYGPVLPHCKKYQHCEQTPLVDCVSGNCREHCSTYCRCAATRSPLKKRTRQLAKWPTELGIK